MNWIVASIGMFVASVALYMFIRKSQIIGYSDIEINIAMFTFPAFGYGALSFMYREPLILSPQIVSMFVAAAYFFAYLGNKLSLTSTSIAPNSGYSLIISKSYSIFTTLAAVILYGSEISYKSMLAILVIIVFAACIVITKSSSPVKGSRYEWCIYAVLAFFAWGMLALASKYFIDLGIPVFTRLFYVSFFVSLFVGIEMWMKKTYVNFRPKAMRLTGFIGISQIFFNYFMQQGYATAPNPGYIMQ